MATARLTLNSSQRAAVSHDGHVSLSACPGSGKTRVIVEKLLRCVGVLEGGVRRAACITYTNSAVAEIESRLYRFGGSDIEEYVDVGTIHSFCLNAILQPYHHLLPELELGYTVTSPDCEWFQDTVRRIGRHHNLRAWVNDRFSGIQRQPDGSLFVPDGIPIPAANELCEDLVLDCRISLSDILFYSLQILVKFPYVGRSVSSKYRWLVIDEFQDTTWTQVEIFKEIHKFRRTEFFIVGDPNQSILSFAGARKALMDQFSIHIGARSDIVLNGNYRSSEKIINLAERLYQLTPPMVAVGKHRRCPIEPSYIQTHTPFHCLWDYFLPALDEYRIDLGKAAVLAPWWFTLFKLGRQLRDRNVPIVGPGARPYKGNLLFAQFAEAVGAYLSGFDADQYSRLRRAFFWLVLNAVGSPDWRIYSFGGKRVLAKLVAVAKDCKKQDELAIGFLNLFASKVGNILVSEGYVPESNKALIMESAQMMVSGIRENLPNPNTASVDFLAMFARPAECLQLLTMHGAKGREFDAVAVVDVHDDKVPHWSADASGVEEAKRLMYVTATRARRLLMYFSDTSEPKNAPSRFLGDQGLRLLV